MDLCAYNNKHTAVVSHTLSQGQHGRGKVKWRYSMHLRCIFPCFKVEQRKLLTEQHR